MIKEDKSKDVKAPAETVAPESEEVKTATKDEAEGKVPERPPTEEGQKVPARERGSALPREEKKKETPDREKTEEAPALNSKLQKLVDAIEKLTLLELSDLVKVLEKKFGISAAAPMVAATVPGIAAAEAVPEEKTEFTVFLTAVGEKKIQVIKEVRAVTDLGLKEAKELVESAPGPIKENLSKEEAEAIKKKLEGVGATVELK